MAKGLFKIYIGNLDYKVTEFAVRRLFESYGEIEDIAMAKDKETGKPRGFAIVMMRNHDQARTAIEGVQGRRLMGRALVVNEAIPKKKNKAAAAAAAASAAAGAGGRPGGGRPGGSRPVSSRGASGSARSFRSSDGGGSRGAGGGSSSRNPRRAGGSRNPRRGGSR